MTMMLALSLLCSIYAQAVLGKIISRESTTGYLHSNLHLSCLLEVDEPWITVQWKRHVDGEILTITTLLFHSSEVLFAEGVENTFKRRVTPSVRNGQKQIFFDLVINNLECSDQGLFQCDATTVNGVRSRIVNVSLLAEPEDPHINYEVLVIKLGDKFELSCEGNVGVPHGDLHWYRLYPGDKDFRLYQDRDKNVYTRTGACTYKVTKYITIDMSSDLNGAVYRCNVGGKEEYYDQVTIKLPELPIVNKTGSATECTANGCYQLKDAMNTGVTSRVSHFLMLAISLMLLLIRVT